MPQAEATHRRRLGLAGRNSVPAGAKAYLRDAPDAEVHVIDGAGRFAPKTHLGEISPLVGEFLAKLP
ncbi:hypothetical protein OG311_16100 [Streptomyces sp. NBC_01343]|uniref:hypothetical protein n=1 Tax=Streptomyces sp. NBC_01343 TaxID=2903832 RepID=UPI002E1399F4|nr:hypothetical protein OG311_16100 [Streptomyces sp. NBC_01343]